jgi:DNA-binding transcriptional MerR regulator
MSRQRSMEKILASEYVSIGELVRLSGCRYSTLKFYTEEGILPFKQEDENMTRRFPREEAIVRIKEIMDLKKQGHSIPEIKEKLVKKDNN